MNFKFDPQFTQTIKKDLRSFVYFNKLHKPFLNEQGQSTPLALQLTRT